MENKNNTITHEYLHYQNKYEKIYGKDTICLMQVGDFYEMYATDTNGFDLSRISEITNLVKTKKNKLKEVSYANPYMCGFNLISLERYIKQLLDCNLTVVLITQTSPPPKPKRGVTAIYSPGTYIGDQVQSNYITSIYIQNDRYNGTDLMSIGLCSIDTSTGTCSVYEICGNISDTKIPLDEAYRFILNYLPKEVLIIGFENINIDIISYLELEKVKIHKITNINKNFEKISYQNEFFGKIYKNTSLLTPIENLNMETMPNARLSLVILLDFIHKYNENFINNISPPDIFINNKHLILYNDAIQQLNILENMQNIQNIQNTQIKCLLDVINHCDTPCGKRYMKYAICNPLNDISEINLRYDCTEELLDLKLNLDTQLQQIVDIQKLSRRITLGTISPNELSVFVSSLNIINELFGIIKTTEFNTKYIPTDENINIMNEFINTCKKTFEFEKLKKYDYISDIDNTIFNVGIYPEIDKLHNQVLNDGITIDEIGEVLAKYIDAIAEGEELDTKKGIKKGIKKTTTKIQFKKNKKLGAYLQLTKAKGDILKEKLANITELKISDTLTIDPTKLEFDEVAKGTTKIYFKDISVNSKNSNLVHEKLKNMVKRKFCELLNEYNNTYSNIFKCLVIFVSKADFINSNMKTAQMFGYCKPKIIEHTKSFVDIKELRHPIGERINNGIKYVPHDVCLGKGEIDGMVVFGLNSCGKCFHPNTELIMYDGSMKQAQYITIGDKLMGDDSTPRTVLETTVGEGIMYKITPTKGEPFTVNGPHILCLKSSGYKSIALHKKEYRYKITWFNEEHKVQSKTFTFKNNDTGKGIYETNKVYETKEEAHKEASLFLDAVKTDKDDIIEMSVDDYLKTGSFWKYNYYLYRVGATFPESELPIDPYILGYWLGDGDNAAPRITTENPEVVEYFKNYAESIGLKLKQSDKLSYNISTGTRYGGKNRNTFLNELRALNVMSNKHIPNMYKINSRENQLKILAGIIDSDGCNLNNKCFDITLKDKKLLEDIIWLARSLGFPCYLSECKKTCINGANGPVTGTYYRTCISGDKLKEVPLLLKYKIPQHSDTKSREATMITSFKIEKLDVNKYVGFEVDKNKRFLLSDFTVTHNSSLMKAIGLNIIMAQTGLFTSCSSFEYYPYQQLFARISNNDNIYKKQSSFSHEMTELSKVILRSNKNSVVLGDEIVNSTEYISGTAIVSATLIKLAQAESTFIFASHMHDLMNIEKIKNLKNMGIFHLSTKYDEKTDTLIFDRQLVKGNGNTLYGLLVAKYIVKDDDFMKLANEIKNTLIGESNEIVSSKPTRYSPNVYLDKCLICHKKNTDKTNEGFLDCHHITSQKLCKCNGYVIGGQRVHDNSNLIVLCKSCHYAAHHNKLKINGYIDSTRGRIVDFQIL